MKNISTSYERRSLELADWDAAEQAIMDAATKVWRAFGIANPGCTYSSSKWVTLDIDGVSLPCQCDCTGLLIAIIKYMGYDPKWPVGPTGGFGSGLATATSNFVYNQDGTLSDDWELISTESIEPRAGDIRGQKVYSGGSEHSHADMFVGYASTGKARGLNGGSSNGMIASVDAANNYLDTGVFDIDNAASTIADGNYTAVLRYVKGANQPSSSPDSGIATNIRGFNSLDIYLGLIEPGQIKFSIMNSSGEYRRVEPGYRKITAMYKGTEQSPHETTFIFSDLGKITVKMGYGVAFLQSDTEHKWYLLFTTDGSDPLTNGRTVYQKQKEGHAVNDIDKSIGFAVYIIARLPFCIRAVVKDANDDSIIQAAGTGYFTTQTDRYSDFELSGYIKMLRHYFLADLDATRHSPNAIDTHPQLYLNDSDDIVKAEPYMTVIPGLPGME